MSSGFQNTVRNLVQPYAARESSDSHRAARKGDTLTGQHRNWMKLLSGDDALEDRLHGPVIDSNAIQIRLYPFGWVYG